MKSILHDWTDDHAVMVLSHCREVLPPGGLVLIVEPVLPEAVGTSAAADVIDGGAPWLNDLNMSVNAGGGERTREDFEEVCHRAGLSLTPVTPLTEAAREELTVRERTRTVRDRSGDRPRRLPYRSAT